MHIRHSTRRFGHLLRDRRRNLGLDTQELADLAGVSRSNISRYESGERLPTSDTVRRLAHALNVEFSTLWTAAGQQILPGDLPTIRPYLRTKYDLNAQQIAEISRRIDEWLAQIGEPEPGPVDDEDENDA